MRRASVIVSLLCIVAAPMAACGDTGDSKLSNGQDLPPGTQVDSGGVDGTVGMQNDDAGGGATDSGSAGDPDTGSQPQDSGTTQKDSGSSVDSGHD